MAINLEMLNKIRGGAKFDLSNVESLRDLFEQRKKVCNYLLANPVDNQIDAVELISYINENIKRFLYL